MPNPSKEIPQEEQMNFLHPEFHKSLDTNQLKSEIDSVRRSGNIEQMSLTEQIRLTKQISLTEEKIANIILQETPFFSPCSLPLTELLFQETGINYLKVCDEKEDAYSLMLVTPDGALKLLGRRKNEGIINDNDISGQNNGKRITKFNLIALNQEARGTTLSFKFRGSPLKASKPEKVRSNVLYSIAKALDEEGKDKECIKICRKLINTFPKNVNNYLRLERLLISKFQYKEAVEISRQAIAQFPENPGSYYILGQVLSVSPESPSLEGAIWALEEFIKKADKDKNWQYQISEAQEYIKELKGQARINGIIIALLPREQEQRLKAVELYTDPNYHYPTPGPEPKQG